MKDQLLILYVGSLAEGGTCLQRRNALRRLGHRVVCIDTEDARVRARQRGLWSRVARKVRGPADLAGANGQILKAGRHDSFDVLWLDKGTTIRADTLQLFRQRTPDCRIVGYSPDDMSAPHCNSRAFLQHLTEYDVFFTTKSYNVSELRALGCRRVVFVENGYDPETHRPIEVTAEERARLGGDVGFVGFYEEERARSIDGIAADGVPVRVWSPNWKHRARARPCLRIEDRGVWGDEYARSLCAFDINLAFLCKRNRDLQTTRSIEIPACGGFMLAERTAEHLGLFEEGREAVFFEGDEELLDKVRYYSCHPEARRRVAAAGRERCLRSGYSNQERFQPMLETVLSG